MVVKHYFGSDAGCLKCMVANCFNKISLLYSSHGHAGIVARVKRLVLRVMAVILIPSRLHCLYVFYKISGIRIIILRFQTPADGIMLSFIQVGGLQGVAMIFIDGLIARILFKTGIKCVLSEQY